MSGYTNPSKLTPETPLDGFHCGSQALDEWLDKHALTNQRAGTSTTFVTSETGSQQIAGYYALATGGVVPSDAPARVTKGVPRHPIPVIILARLAVHEDHQGRRIGRGLLRDAMLRVAAAAQEVGVRALLIHAKDDDAREFYLAQADFEPSLVGPLQLFLLLKDLRRAIEA